MGFERDIMMFNLMNKFKFDQLILITSALLEKHYDFDYGKINIFLDKQEDYFKTYYDLKLDELIKDQIPDEIKDLKKIKNKKSIEIIECENPNCDNKFTKYKRKTYCSDACKQESYRLRKLKEYNEIKKAPPIR